MGAWGLGAFENDDALDWVAELEEDESGDAVRRALDAAADAGGYLEAPEGAEALAAAEVVAAAAGRPGEGLPEEVEAWVAAHGGAVAGEAERARRAVDRVAAADSELRELWEEAEGSAGPWHELLADLRRRLGG